MALQDNHRLAFIQQLRPTQTAQPRIKLKIFGQQGAGKSALLESLKCGILRSFFRRRRRTAAACVGDASRHHPNSPLNSKPAGRLRTRGDDVLWVSETSRTRLLWGGGGGFCQGSLRISCC